MPLSVRLDPALEQRLRDASAREGVPLSTLVRRAIARHCDEVLGSDLRARMSDLIGVIHTEGGRAERSSEAFAEALRAKRQR